MESMGDDTGFTRSAKSRGNRRGNMKMGLRRWVRERWKSKLAMALFVVGGMVYAGHRLDKLLEEGLVLRGGLIEGVAGYFGAVAVALVIVLGTTYLCKWLVERYRKEGQGGAEDNEAKV